MRDKTFAEGRSQRSAMLTLLNTSKNIDPDLRTTATVEIFVSFSKYIIYFEDALDRLAIESNEGLYKKMIDLMLFKVLFWIKVGISLTDRASFESVFVFVAKLF